MLAAHVPLIINNIAVPAPVQWPGGQGVFAVVGTFSGATVNLQFVGPDGTTLVTVGTNTTLTAPGAGMFYLHPCVIVATVTGTPSGIYASADRVPF